MDRCLYTWAPLNTHEPPDDLSSTLEHIIPVSLGGSAAFSISYCSKRANNDLGRDIDAPFSELPTIGMKRHELGIKGNSGTVPPLRFPGECVELNEPCEIIFPYNAAPYADFGIHVDGGLKEGQVKFEGDKARIMNAVIALQRKAKKSGLDVIGQDQKINPTVEELIDSAFVRNGKRLHFRLVINAKTFWVPWAKGIVKMALGFGALTLGKSWAFSTEADVLRSALLLPPDKFFTDGHLKGQPAIKLDEGISQMLGIEKNKHTFAILPHGKRMLAVISLFGGQAFDAIVELGDGPSDYKPSNDRMRADWKCVYTIDPSNRSVQTMTVAELERRVPKA